MSDDILDENGLTVKTRTDIIESFISDYQSIYGDDIDLGSHTSDGQAINIHAQIQADFRELLREVYNSCNPDYCRGSVQDVRFKINNLKRKGGSFTVVPITIVTSSTVTLQGLDANYNDVNATAYGGTDNSGNKYYLIDSVTLTTGTHTVAFRYQDIGYNLPIVDTIVNPITIVKGVESITNASAPTSIGQSQESDEAFSLRRERSTETKAQNNVDAMRSQLLALDGVTDAYVYMHDDENYPDQEDADGIPVNGIWVIVEGGSNADICTVIYANSGNARMKGDIAIETVTASMQTFTAHFDRSSAQPLYIKFDIQKVVTNTSIDQAAIKAYIANNLTYTMNDYAETSRITEVARLALDATGTSGVALNVQISIDGKIWDDYIAATAKNKIFTIDTSRISITEINLS